VDEHAVETPLRSPLNATPQLDDTAIPRRWNEGAAAVAVDRIRISHPEHEPRLEHRPTRDDDGFLLQRQSLEQTREQSIRLLRRNPRRNEFHIGAVEHDRITKPRHP